MQNVLGFRLKLMCFLLLLLLLQAQILSHAEPIKSVYTALSRFVSEFPGHVLFSHAEILPVQKAVLPFLSGFQMDSTMHGLLGSDPPKLHSKGSSQIVFGAG